MTSIQAWTATTACGPLQLREFDPGPLGPEEIEIAVEHCGVCHSDLSVLDNEWGNSIYPFVPGHEAVGRIVAMGGHAKGLSIGQRVGIGWTCGSCLHCQLCVTGAQHLCAASQATIIGHAGGFAGRLRAQWIWAIPLPDALDAASAGPLLCGGITVFSPLLHFGVKPVHRVGVVGIGGLGHMALRFLNAWGCEVIAFTSTPSKMEEAERLGAHRAVSSHDSHALRQLARALDFLLVTANVALDWDALIATLAPQGRLHIVGAVREPIPLKAFSLIGGQRSVSGSPTGAPGDIAVMLEFAARHGILPQVEHFPMSRVNEALEHVRAGKARYRVVLDADFNSHSHK